MPPRNAKRKKATKSPPVARNKSKVMARLSSALEGIQSLLKLKEKEAVVQDPLVALIIQELHIKEVPPSLSWRQVATVKEPWLWALLLDPSRTTMNDVETELGVPGPIFLAVKGILQRSYEGVTSAEGMINKVMHCFVSAASLIQGWTPGAVNGAMTAERLVRQLRPCMESAEEELARLDSKLISLTAGERAAATYLQTRTLLQPQNFPVTAGDALKCALKSAISARKVGEGNTFPKNGNANGRRCSKCKAEVSGSFKEHNKVCSKKKVKEIKAEKA